MNISKWVKNKMVALSLAMASVEKEVLSQDTEAIGLVQNKNKGTLADDLINGKKTQEVTRLRARMYKVMEAADKLKFKGRMVLGEQDNEDGDIDTEVEMKFIYEGVDEFNRNTISDKIKFDPFNDEKVVLVIDNKRQTKTLNQVFSNEEADEKTHITRDFRPTFEIEKYSPKIVVRDLGEKERLLEFYISMYPSTDDRKTRLLISEIKKAKENPRVTNILEFITLEVITNNDIGAENLRLFKYNYKSFDKIVEYDGFYILKFKVTEEIGNFNIADEYKDSELDNLYENKSPRTK